ncbi:MAG: transposase of IS1604-like element [Haloplasmataceae bacterium]|nr:transposase of IS1604-like element [Haloplasmataceae bacterium]
MNGQDWNQFKSVEDINDSLGKFVNQYNNEEHSGINNLDPKSRFVKNSERLRYVDKDDLEKHFLHREERRVLNDGTIKINSLVFEVPQEYISQRIQVRYLPFDLSKAFIYDKDELIEIYQLNRVDNSKVKRKNSIDFTKVSGGEMNV